MNLQAAPLNRNLNASHQPHSGLISDHSRVGETAEIVVISQREDVDAVLGSPARNFSRRQKAVRRGGMAVKVDNLHGIKRRTEKNQADDDSTVTKSAFCL